MSGAANSAPQTSWEGKGKRDEKREMGGRKVGAERKKGGEKERGRGQREKKRGKKGKERNGRREGEWRNFVQL